MNNGAASENGEKAVEQAEDVGEEKAGTKGQEEESITLFQASVIMSGIHHQTIDLNDAYFIECCFHKVCKTS